MTLTSQDILWIILGAAVVIVLLGLILLRARRQSVSFDATAAVPPPAPRTPAPPPPSAPIPTPIAAGSDPQPAPPPLAAAAPAATELTRLKGLGPKAAARLADLGVTGLAALAALPEADAHRIDDQLGPFQGRMARDRWVEQARMLQDGEIERYEATFGKLGGGAA